MAADIPPPRPTHRRRTAWILISAVLVILVAWGAWVGARALQAKDELEALLPAASSLQDALASGDLSGAEAVAEDIARRSARAAELSGDALWRAAEVLPVAGPNLSAVRVVSAQLHALSAGAIKPLLGVSSDLSALTAPEHGSIDVAAIEAAHDPLAEAARTLTSASKELERLASTPLLPQLQQGVAQLSGAVERAREVATRLADTSSVLPTMLGSEGPRSILLVFQNNAELRTGGGITAAFAEVRAEGGALTLVDQANSGDFPGLGEPIMPLPESITALYGDVAGKWVQNITMPADFDVSGRLASEWWNMRTGHRPDLVVSVDPVALQAALAVLGPIDVPGWGPLTGDDAAYRLLVEPYLSLDEPAQQDAVFQAAAASTFEAVLAGATDPVGLVTAMQQPIAEGRLSAWSAHASEQEVLAAGPLGGQLARQRAAGDEAFAVHLNDATGAKMDSFLDVAIATVVTECRADGRRDIALAVTLTNTVAADAAATLPVSLTGNGMYGVAPGNIGTYVTVAAPSGTFFGGVTRNEGRRHSIQTVADGTASSQARLNLEPGETDTLVFRFVASAPGDIEPTILHTPTMGAVEVAEPVAGTCGS